MLDRGLANGEPSSLSVPATIFYGGYPFPGSTYPGMPHPTIQPPASAPQMPAVDLDALFAPEVIADPYPFFGRLREQDPVHWNAPFQLWVDAL